MSKSNQLAVLSYTPRHGRSNEFAIYGRKRPVMQTWEDNVMLCGIWGSVSGNHGKHSPLTRCDAVKFTDFWEERKSNMQGNILRLCSKFHVRGWHL
jgi:hypothetical protein